MTAKELADKLLEHPNFEVRFSFMEPDGSHYGFVVRTFENLSVSDIGHSDKVMILGGDER